jgi:hypothetical protein
MLTRLFFSIVWIAVLAAVASAQDSPTSLACTSNAKASRDYGFGEKQWSGTIPPEPAKVFGISTVKQRQPNDPLRDKVFSSLNTPTPVIRSITPPRQAIGFPEGEAVEFKGTVVSRLAEAVFIMWQNDYGNKVWLAALDLKHKKATVSQVFQGVTSIGIEAETLDCK